MSAMDEPSFPRGASEFDKGMPLRTYAAIHLRVPASGIPELDEMIRKARRQEMVGRALQGLLATGIWTVGECATNAEAAADAAIKAMEEKP